MRAPGSWHLPDVKDPTHTPSQLLNRRVRPGQDDDGDLATHRQLPQNPEALGDVRRPSLSRRRRAECQDMQHVVEMLLPHARQNLPLADQQAYRKSLSM